jgi:hypothetical protein
MEYEVAIRVAELQAECDDNRQGKNGNRARDGSRGEPLPAAALGPFSEEEVRISGTGVISED